jgi:hypothetical protein
METKELIKRCFVIGPMKDNMIKLETLARRIVAPILEPHGFRIITPDEGNIGTIMDQVLLNLEQADILIADITGNNPNVLYELGVYHSFGKPSIVLKDSSVVNPKTKGKNKGKDDTPFDIAAYRFLEIPFDNTETALAILKPRLDDIVKVLGERDWFPNPVTSFYDSPVAEIPTAVGLSKNYLKNFMGMILPDVFFKFESNDAYQLDVKYEIERDNYVLLNKEERDQLKFEILIPEKMHIANHEYIRNIKEGKLVDFKNAKVIRRSREFNMQIRFEGDGTPVLMDIPTVLSTLNESIQRRRGLKETQIDNNEWLILEKQELERFANKCELFKKKLETEFPSIRNKINVVWRWSIEQNKQF